MPLLSKVSNVVQNVFYLYDVTGFTPTSCRETTEHHHHGSFEVTVALKFEGLPEYGGGVFYSHFLIKCIKESSAA